MRKLAACVALLSLTSCGYLQEQRLLRSLPAMEQVAKTAPPWDGKEHHQKVGELEFQDIWRDGDRVYFREGEAVVGVDPFGYVWSPKSIPTDGPNRGIYSFFEHIQGSWYHWSDSY
ncbi:hypothetical protein [Herbidospora sp. RD11066]